ncbi:hypothetical protein [Aestuariibaculum marinum]|uniref:Uncharacterized protein n=1 Tax=Aestuariibaculum marinum TaxID=2683592 RepID=A0A8J6U674_9FLAO|nr:hypothetical protein [Aestuariibaculum marinum]MBD0824459.1 hypothetical protein [Aestuariibaculum marinum]
MCLKLIIIRPVSITLFIMAFNLSGGQNNIKEIELKIQRSIRQLAKQADKKENDSVLIADNLMNLSQTTSQLFSAIYKDNLDEKNDSLFFLSLESSQKSLEKLVAIGENNSYINSVIDAIQSDYLTKIKASALGADSTIKTEVRVLVYTRKGDKEIGGYEVKCNYLWDFKNPNPKFIFNNPTNNAERNLAPGYYFMWIEKDGKLIQKKDKLEIGNLHSQEESIIFNL